MGERQVVYEISGVTKRFAGADRAANDDISFTIEQGEFFGMLGSNGAGKTTLIKQMVGLLKSGSGSIRLLGRDVLADPVFTSMRVSYMPQNAFALNSLTTSEAIYVTAHLRGLGRREARRRRDELIERLDLGAMRDKAAQRMSGGQRRLLQLAVALAADLPVLILDEPTNELDPARRRMVWDLLRELNHQQGRTIVLITHNALEAEQVIERVGILREGRLVAVGRPAELKSGLAKTLSVHLTLRDGMSAELPDYLLVQSRHRGKVVAQVSRTDVARLTSDLDLDEFLEFRLQSKTLEEVYFEYGN
ncbi:ABC transporter ATP-binding protein [Streptomyces sp. ME19-01-6]|uniref:ABC transporter ATP-binding protein n=1 Tax=Streptomyces sp. ME19-01-6 TaxID=3028686 RepID=UPI0029A81BC7|nr:ABC transporter ATP-binding protein [Streptomyces sp. ME19-01-6]MDX3230827.1 ABC transporter ATP-binding protein [Streptomyces sp. ME19-01-6]